MNWKTTKWFPAFKEVFFELLMYWKLSLENIFGYVYKIIWFCMCAIMSSPRCLSYGMPQSANCAGKSTDF